MIGTVLIFIAVLAVIILIHEFGHYISARIFKVNVEEFGVGFPPRITGIRLKKTLYSINWIPAGGFVRLKGEQGDHKEDEDSFTHKKPWQRAIILFAGVLMNIFLAMAILSAGYMIGLPKATESDLGNNARVTNQHIEIVSVREGSPAKQAGLASGDVITELNDVSPTTTDQVKNVTETNLDTPINVSFTRDKEPQSVTVTPKILSETPDRPTIGIATIAVGDVSYPFFMAIWMGIKESIQFLWLISTALWGMLASLIMHQPVQGDLVGPIGVAVITSKFAHLGFIYLLQFVAIISLNLAIINVLPIPALDGGRLLFLLIEKIKGSPINQKTEAVIHNIGFIAILLLIGFITVRDIFQLDKINSLF